MSTSGLHTYTYICTHSACTYMIKKMIKNDNKMKMMGPGMKDPCKESRLLGDNGSHRKMLSIDG